VTTTAADAYALRKSLPDHASDEDTRGLAIDRVGISDLDYPIVVLDKRHEQQHTVAKVAASVTLPKEQRGTHMSRFVEVLNSVRGEITVRNLPKILRQMQARLEADRVQLHLDFPYFISKLAPVSRVESLLKYDCGFHATANGADVDFLLRVDIPVTTLCPCSKAISKYGAHNQRGVVSVALRTEGFAWIEDVVALVESCASAPLYSLLKREDEKAVTEQAYENPSFVEDLLREVSVRLRDELGATWLHVAVENAESIHNHAAFAELTWQEDRDETADEAPPALPGHAQAASDKQTFGSWLAGVREERGYSQAEFARLLDVSASYLSRIERGEKQPTAGLAHAVAIVTGHDPQATALRAGFVDAELRGLLADNLDEIRALTQPDRR
jgi:GTP cyclohydrolase I